MTEENKIIDNELAKLGFETKKEQPPQVIAPSPVSKPIKPKRIVQKSPDLFGVPDIPEFLDRRKTKVADKRGDNWLPKAVLQSASCVSLQNRLAEIRKSVEQNQGSPDAIIETKDLDDLTDIITKQLGDMFEHAGFIYISGDAALRLKQYIRMYLLTNCKVYNGAMYRYPVENVKRDAKAD